MAKGKLELYKIIPNFKLSSTENKQIQVLDYKQKKNLVIFFYNGGQCLSCLERLRSFGAHYKEYKESNAEILAISTDPVDLSIKLKEQYRLPFPLLSDPDAKESSKFTLTTEGAIIPAVLVVDRFGSLFGQWIVTHEEGQLPDDKKYLKTLEYIETQCPECGIFPEEKRA